MTARRLTGLTTRALAPSKKCVLGGTTIGRIARFALEPTGGLTVIAHSLPVGAIRRAFTPDQSGTIRRPSSPPAALWPPVAPAGFFGLNGSLVTGLNGFASALA